MQGNPGDSWEEGQDDQEDPRNSWKKYNGKHAREAKHARNRNDSRIVADIRKPIDPTHKESLCWTSPEDMDEQRNIKRATTVTRGHKTALNTLIYTKCTLIMLKNLP